MTDREAIIWIDDNAEPQIGLAATAIIDKKGLSGALSDSTFKSLIRNTPGGREFLKNAEPVEKQLAKELKDGDLDITDNETWDLAQKYGVSADEVKKAAESLKQDKAERDYAKRKEQLKAEQEQRDKDLNDYSSWVKAWKGEAWKEYSLPARLALATGMKLVPDISKDEYIETGESNTATNFIGGATEAASFVPGVGKGVGVGTKKLMPKAVQYATRALQYGADPTLRAVHSNQDAENTIGSAVLGTLMNATFDNIPFRVIGDIAKGQLGQGEKLIGKKIEQAAEAMDKSRILENKTAIDAKLLKDFDIDYSKTPKGMTKRDYAFKKIREWANRHKDDPLAIRNKADELVAAGYPKDAEYLMQSDWLNMPYAPERPDDYIGAIGIIGNPRKAKELTREANITTDDGKIVHDIKQRPYIDERIILQDMMKKPPSKAAGLAGTLLRGSAKAKFRQSPKHKNAQPDELVKRQWAAGFVPTKGTPEYREYEQWLKENAQ